MWRAVREIAAVAGIALRLLVSPRTAVPDAIAHVRTGPFLCLGFFALAIVDEMIFPSAERRLSGGLLIGSATSSVLQYLLAYRILDGSAWLHGGTSRHVELRWLGFLISAAFTSIGAGLSLGHVLANPLAPSLGVWLAVAGLAVTWFAAVWAAVVTELYGFGIWRAAAALLAPLAVVGALFSLGLAVEILVT